MKSPHALLENITSLVRRGNYRVRIHTIRHMVEEGFSENDIISAILENSKIIEMYHEDQRCLIVGTFMWSNKSKSPIHIICDYSNRKLIDIVTAYIPQRPWWISPTRRGKMI